MTIEHHNPQRDASARLGDGFAGRVLEPSPPAVTEAPSFSDDPASVGADAETVVTPTTAGSLTWDDIVTQRPELADYARSHWLGNRKHLDPVPDDYSTAREAFHRLAFAVVAEARRVANTKFGLRYTHGGYGTPFFGADEQVRIEGTTLVRQTAEAVDTLPITTIRAAADFVGVAPGTEAAEHDSPPLGDVDEVLEVSDASGEFLGDWFGFAWAVLEELRLTEGAADVDRLQLWPGHFDPALAMGDAEAGGRATYGMSPGDQSSDEPYLYVGAWGDVDSDDPFWNATSFNGALLSYPDLRAATDPHAAALEFFRTGYAKLAG